MKTVRHNTVNTGEDFGRNQDNVDFLKIGSRCGLAIGPHVTSQ